MYRYADKLATRTRYGFVTGKTGHTVYKRGDPVAKLPQLYALFFTQLIKPLAAPWLPGKYEIQQSRIVWIA